MNDQSTTTVPLVGSHPVCGQCQATAVLRDAWAVWNRLTAVWELQATFDSYHCEACGTETAITWQVDTAFRKKRIRRLNDALRRGDVRHGTLVITEGIRALGDDEMLAIMHKVAEFDSFSEDNDPHEEHDFGSFDHKGQTLYWKIDYFDREMTWHPPDKANPELTHRVLTVMLAMEY